MLTILLLILFTKPKKLIFDINKFSKFRDKIVYIPINQQPPGLIEIKESDSVEEKQSKMTMNAKEREMHQINKAQDGICLLYTSPSPRDRG